MTSLTEAALMDIVRRLDEADAELCVCTHPRRDHSTIRIYENEETGVRTWMIVCSKCFCERMRRSLSKGAGNA